MNPMNIFVGVPQSKYAGIAILVAMIIVAFAMIFGKEQVPAGQKFLFVLIMFIVALPTILFTLFQLTCLVTGAGMKNQRWWCAAYAWIGTIFIILYSVIIVTVGIASLVNGSNVLSDINQTMSFEQMQDLANQQAREYFQNMDMPKKENPMHAEMAAGPDTSAPDNFTVGGAMDTKAAVMSSFTVGGATSSHSTPVKQPFVVGGATASPSHVKQPFTVHKEGFAVPEYVPPETEAEKNTKKMLQQSDVPAPAPNAGMENFADFTLTEEEKKEMFGIRH